MYIQLWRYQRKLDPFLRHHFKSLNGSEPHVAFTDKEERSHVNIVLNCIDIYIVVLFKKDMLLFKI